uniref:Putative secreted protein n=1 Tax=Anopheles marajoara TaxID=58244 RepID=A0A2M4CDB0_9DIPT
MQCWMLLLLLLLLLLKVLRMFSGHLLRQVSVTDGSVLRTGSIGCTSATTRLHRFRTRSVVMRLPTTPDTWPGL